MSLESKYCQGQEYTSVKQLIGVSGYVGRVSSAAEATGPSMPIYDFWNVKQFAQGVWYKSGTSVVKKTEWDATLFATELGGDVIYRGYLPYCSYFALMYAYARGSTLVTTRGGKTRVCDTAITRHRYYSPWGGVYAKFHKFVSDAFVTRARLPFHSVYPYMPSGVNRPQFLTSPTRGEAATMEGVSDVYVHAADDAQLGTFISTWPLVVAPSTKFLKCTAFDVLAPYLRTLEYEDAPPEPEPELDESAS